MPKSCQLASHASIGVISPARTGLKYVLVEPREREVEPPGDVLSVARPLVRWKGTDDAGEVAAEPDPRRRVRVRPTAFDDRSFDELGSERGRGGEAFGECHRAFRTQDVRRVDAFGEVEMSRACTQGGEPPERALARLPAC